MPKYYALTSDLLAGELEADSEAAIIMEAQDAVKTETEHCDFVILEVRGRVVNNPVFIREGDGNGK